MKGKPVPPAGSVTLVMVTRPISGCQSGPSSKAGPLVKLVGPVPSAFMTKISKAPSRLLVKAICVPSGDQAGRESLAALPDRLVGPVPSAFMT